MTDPILNAGQTPPNRLSFRSGLQPDVNDADRLAVDPVMRQVVGGRAVDVNAASASQMGRFETEVLATADNRAALADLSGHWIDRVHAATAPKWITLDMDSSVSPTRGAQEGTAWNGHFGCMCYHPLFVFNQFGMLDAAPSATATSKALTAGEMSSPPSLPDRPSETSCGSSGPMPPMRSRHSMSDWKRQVVSMPSG